MFGPLLGVVTFDVLNGKIGWSHWEQTAEGPVAVFRFTVQTEESTYIVRYCCVLKDGKLEEFKTTPAYHGEIAVEPSTCAVLRIVLKTNLPSDVDLSRADLAIEYKRIDIGGRNYILPTKSISILTTPLNIAINDVVFDRYHQFRTEMRIVPLDAQVRPR